MLHFDHIFWFAVLLCFSFFCGTVVGDDSEIDFSDEVNLIDSTLVESESLPSNTKNDSGEVSMLLPFLTSFLLLGKSGNLVVESTNTSSNFTSPLYEEPSTGRQIVKIITVVGISLGIGAATVIVVPLFLYGLLWCCGFSRSGVRGGSYAAIRHSEMGNVSKGSCFACCQSTGATGASGILFNWAFLTIICVLSGSIAGSILWFYY